MSVLPAFAVTPTLESLTRYRMALADGVAVARPEDAVPLGWFSFLRAQPALGLSIHDTLGRDPDRGLFGGASYRRLGRIAPGDRLEANAELIERKSVSSSRGDLFLTTMRIDYRYHTEVRLTETVRMVDLPAGPPQLPARGPEAKTELPEVARLAPLTRRQIAWMTVETGDLNPLHLDPEYAHHRCFPDVVAPGPLLVALTEEALTRIAGAPLSALELRLRAPSYPGDAFTLHAAHEGARWRWLLVCAGELRAEGVAEGRG